MIIKNLLNANTFEKKYKAFTQPTRTIPDQSLSIREILERYSRGLPLDVKEPIWDDNADDFDYIPDPRRLDLADREEFAANAKAELDVFKKKLSEKSINKLAEPEIAPPVAQSQSQD